MTNELIFLTVITGITIPTYFMFATKYASHKKIRLFIHIATFISFFLLGQIYQDGILEIGANPFLVFGLMGLIGTPSLLFSIYTKKKILPLSFENRKKYYLDPTIAVVAVIMLIALLRSPIN